MLEIRRLHRPGLDALPFVLNGGECVAMRGPSGSGKTLFLRAIADLDPNEGEILLDGVAREAIAAPLWRRRVTYVAAEPGWWAETVGEHFVNWAAAAWLIDAVLLPQSCHEWPVLRLSTGERQRLGLVRAVVLEPRVLLLDEPTSALDEAARDAVEATLGRLRERTAISLVLVTHDTDQARRLADYVVRIDRGAVTAQGRVEEVLAA